MKKIRTQSTLVYAKHGLVTNGRSTKIFDRKQNSQYAYELHIKDPTAIGCTGMCQMAAPIVLQFQTANPAPVSISMTGGFGSYSDWVVPLTVVPGVTPPPAAGQQQKIELDATVSHKIGSIPLQDAFRVQVM